MVNIYWWHSYADCIYLILCEGKSCRGCNKAQEIERLLFLKNIKCEVDKSSYEHCMSFGTFAQFLDKKCNVTITTFLIACSPQLSCNQRHSISSLRVIHNEVLGTVRYQKVGESCACDLIWEGGSRAGDFGSVLSARAVCLHRVPASRPCSKSS